MFGFGDSQSKRYVRAVVSELSGRGNIVAAAREVGDGGSAIAATRGWRRPEPSTSIELKIIRIRPTLTSSRNSSRLSWSSFSRSWRNAPANAR